MLYVYFMFFLEKLFTLLILSFFIIVTANLFIKLFFFFFVIMFQGWTSCIFSVSNEQMKDN